MAAQRLVISLSKMHADRINKDVREKWIHPNSVEYRTNFHGTWQIMGDKDKPTSVCLALLRVHSSGRSNSNFVEASLVSTNILPNSIEISQCVSRNGNCAGTCFAIANSRFSDKPSEWIGPPTPRLQIDVTHVSNQSLNWRLPCENFRINSESARLEDWKTDSFSNTFCMKFRIRMIGSTINKFDQFPNVLFKLYDHSQTLVAKIKLSVH